MVTGAWLVAGIFLLIGFWYLSRLARQEAEEIFTRPVRWIVTAGAVALVIGGLRIAEGIGAFILVTVCLFLSWVWLPALVNTALSPLFDAMTGGRDEVDPTPFFHRATALRKRGQYDAALQEVQYQLERFPNDFDGLMLLAEIESDDLKNLPGAIETLEQIASSTTRESRERILALNRIADLEIRRENREGARAALQRIVVEFPKTDSSRFAEQRLAHLPDDQVMAARRETPTVPMPSPSGSGIQLRRSGRADDPAMETPNEKLESLRAAVRRSPEDCETREQLALLYAHHFKDYAKATGEMEMLIQGEHQPQRTVARWLNMLADIHLSRPDGLPDALAALKRIGEKFPGSALAEAAESRLGRLSAGAQPKEPPRRIRIGNYEKNIGLKP